MENEIILWRKHLQLQYMASEIIRNGLKKDC